MKTGEGGNPPPSPENQVFEQSKQEKEIFMNGRMEDRYAQRTLAPGR